MSELASQRYINYITDRLAALTVIIADLGRLNLTDIHVMSENFFAGLLNIAYGWNLKNANIALPNAKGIDLIDDNEKIIVQVSATCTKEKIEHSLQEIGEEFRGYHFYFLPMIIGKADSQKKQTYFPPHDVVFNPKTDIIERVDLIRALQSDVNGERLEAAYNYIRKNLSLPIDTEAGTKVPAYSELQTHLSAQLKHIRECHPSFKLMKIDDGLFPQGVPELHNIEARNDANEIKTVSEIVADSWSRDEKNHLMIEGEGGIGKTVTLLSLPDKFVPHEVLAVYVQLHELKGVNKDETIEEYIKDKYFRSKDSLYKLFQALTEEPWKNGLRVLLLLDGFNEIAPDMRHIIGADINRWANRPGIQIITSSRFDIHSYVPLGEGYSRILLQQLSRETVKEYLDKATIEYPNTESQWSVISFPLMLTLYAQTQSLMNIIDRDDNLQDFRENNSAGAIIWNYLQRELWRYRQHNTDVARCVFSAEFIAPYIAWKMQKGSMFFLEEEIFYDYLDEAYDVVSKLTEKHLPPHIRRVLRNLEIDLIPKKAGIRSFIGEEHLRLFIRNGTIYSLMHQQFRDALAALHLINLSYASAELPEDWKTPVDYYVMEFVADLATPKEADCLWEMNRVMSTHMDAATINMLELQKRKRNCDFSGLNFSGLDLRDISLFPYRIPGTRTLRLPKDKRMNTGLKVSPKTFYPGGHHGDIIALSLTPDGKRILIGSRDGTLCVWDLESGQCMKTLEGHRGNIMALSLTSDGKRCVSGSSDRTLRVWDIESGQCLHTLEGHISGIITLSLTLDGKRCVSGSLDSTLRVWDLTTYQVILTITVLPLTVVSIDFSKSIIPLEFKETLRQNGAIV